MKSLKIPKGQSEVFDRTGTDKTMIKSKRAKGQINIHTTLHRKQRLSSMNSTKNRGELRCSGRETVSAPLVALVIFVFSNDKRARVFA